MLRILFYNKNKIEKIFNPDVIGIKSQIRMSVVMNSTVENVEVEIYRDIITSLTETLNALYEKIIMEQLKIYDFVYSGSFKPNKKSQTFNNCAYTSVLNKMCKSKQIKCKEFEFGKPKNGKYKTRKYYYLRLSEEKVDTMTMDDVKRDAHVAK